ncbi:Hypothetical predicted protein [Marmota monax]|uniref:Vps16 N-terminal domain-containing protein n=1 Tax=Marmota monax TaxID=9995 RepID=A0A5E4A5P7_MARMO|nr:hypothetical protein GHT09_015841 [Marmota monax]VTJ52236.1 Hypothetical predicted protein [Marmota monax]
MDCYTANWNPLGDSAFYRKYELYSMDWDLKEELRDCLVAAAPYGGPIALLRNPWRKEKAASVRPVLEIYSASGMPLASLLWKSGPVVSLGWSAEEELLCVQEDGAVLVYGLHGDFRRHFSMGNEVLQNRVLDARIFHTEFGSGVAILTGAHRFTLSANVGDLKLRRMPEVPGLQSAPSCWTTLCQDRVAHILLAVGPDLYLLDHATCSAVMPPGLAPGVSSFLQMAVSFTYRHLALFTDTGYIWMGTASLKEKLCEFNCNIRAPPKQMVWCSRPRSKERAVVVAWERLLMVVGDAPESIQFVLDEDSYLVPELDGVRIFSRSTHEFLHEVPVASEEIFKIASMAPGALLLEAQKEYEKESQKADEYLREIQELGQLTQAVQQCIEAAGHEHRPDMQKSLLRVGLERVLGMRGCWEGGELVFAVEKAFFHCPLALLRRLRLGSVSLTDFHLIVSCTCVRTCVCSMLSGTTTLGFPSPIANISSSPSRCCWTGLYYGGYIPWPSRYVSTCVFQKYRASAGSWPIGPATRCSRKMYQMRMLHGPLIRSWGTRLVSRTLTLLRGPMAVAAQSWPSRCGCPALSRFCDMNFQGPCASSSLPSSPPCSCWNMSHAQGSKCPFS